MIDFLLLSTLLQDDRFETSQTSMVHAFEACTYRLDNPSRMDHLDRDLAGPDVFPIQFCTSRFQPTDCTDSCGALLQVSWSYAWYDNYWKSPKEILHRLTACVGRGGTYMLDIGPRGDGSVPDRAQPRRRRSLDSKAPSRYLHRVPFTKQAGVDSGNEAAWPSSASTTEWFCKTCPMEILHLAGARLWMT